MSGQIEVLAILRMLRPWKSIHDKVRIGAMGDGGYVFPDDLKGINNVVSLGIGDNVSFDQVFANAGASVYQYDPTVEGPPVQHGNFHFHKVAWSHEDGPGAATLQRIMESHDLRDGNDAILKFDTEGCEWEAVKATPPDVFKHFRIIACELHGLNNLHHPDFRQQVRQCLEILTRQHTAVHIHANNCCGMTLVEGIPVPAVLEATFLRNDRSAFVPANDPMPGPLDFPNMPDRPDLVLNPFGGTL